MALPKEMYGWPEGTRSRGLFPIIEVELNGNISFEELIDTIHTGLKIPYRLVRADIEILEKRSFGKLVLELRADKGSVDKARRYFASISLPVKFIPIS